MKKKSCTKCITKISGIVLLILLLNPVLCHARRKKSYVIPISKTEFKIDGKIVDIYKEASIRRKSYMDFMDKHIPDGYEAKVNGAYIYTTQPEWKEEFRFSKLNGLYIISAGNTEVAIRLFKKKQQYTYYYTLKDDQWVLSDNESKNPYIVNVDKIKGNYCYYTKMDHKERQEYIDKIMNCSCFKCDTRCDAETKLDRMLADARRERQAGRSGCGYECFRVIAMDNESHIVLMATHYVGLRAHKMCLEFGIDPTSDYAKDYWRVAPQIIVTEACPIRRK